MREQVTDIRSTATQSSIRISWSAPNTSVSQEMLVDAYYVQYTIGLETSVEEIHETEFMLADLSMFTYVLFSIRAEFQGRLGPEVYIGQSTGIF